MNKCGLLLSFLLISFISQAYQPLNQWMLFTGGYSYMNKKVDMTTNLSGSEAVNAIAEDKDGNIWMAVAGKGLRMFDGKKLLAPKLPKESFIANAEVLSLAFDSKNILWVGTSEGLVKYDGAEWTNIGPEVTGLRAVREIAITPTDKVYMAGFASDGIDFTGGALAFYNGQGWTSFNKSNTSIPDDTLQDLTVDKNGYLWMTVGKHDQGIARFDGKNWKQFHTGNTSALPTNKVRGIATNASGNLWFATTKGVVEYSSGEFKLKPYSNSFSSRMQPLTNSDGSLEALSITVEDNGTIWLGTANHGVIYIKGNLFKAYNNQNSALNGNTISKTLVDKNNRKWFVTGQKNDTWANYYPKEKRTNYTYNASGVAVLKENDMVADPRWTIMDETNSDFKLGNVLSFSQDKDGNLWMPTNGDGLVKIKDGQFTTYKPQGMMTALNKTFIGPDGKIYIATTMNGVKTFQDGQFTDFVKWPNMGGVNDMTVDNNGVFWVTGTGGLSRWVNNDWETFNKKNGDLPSVIFYALHKDAKGNIWAGSAKGLVKYDGTNFQVFTKKEVEFPSDDITAVAEDNTGKLWFGTKAGISIYDGTNWTHISKVESPKLSRFTVNGFSFDKNNVAWIATDNEGLLRYDGTTWKQYGVKTGAFHDKVTAVKAGPDGKVYVVSEFYEFSAEFGSIPSQSQEYQIEQALVKKLKDADPKHILTIFEN
jgi:ligand-binding sensor domain-containing protein